MKHIGKYKGCDCYTCSMSEYNDSYKVSNCIYIIERTMVRDGIIIGHYDGTAVRDVYDRVPFKVRYEPGPEREMVKVKEVVEESEPETTDIDFKNYSKVVDEFFENLN